MMHGWFVCLTISMVTTGHGTIIIIPEQIISRALILSLKSAQHKGKYAVLKYYQFLFFHFDAHIAPCAALTLSLNTADLAQWILNK